MTTRRAVLGIPSAQVRFGILCLLGYVALSWAVRFDMRRGDQIASLVYPLDTFSMYAPAPGTYISHLLIRDGHGTVHRISAFRAFDCGELVTGRPARCADEHSIAYHYDDLIRYIETHRGAGGADATLISRTWQVRAGEAPVQTSECVIAHCKVSQ